MEKKSKIIFERVIKNICDGVLPLKTKIHLLKPNDLDLGYSTISSSPKGTKHAEIFVNPEHELFEELEEAQKYAGSLGVAIHEMLHIWFTNFDEFIRRSKGMQDRKRDLFQNLFNIFEDSRIENFVEDVFGGIAVESLQFTIQRTWEQSPNIDENKDALNQILNALIQYGDMGKIKGDFINEEAKNDFLYVADLHDKALNCHKCSDCLDLAEQATEYLFKKYGQSAQNIQRNDDLSNKSGEGNDAKGSGNGQKQNQRQKTKSSMQPQSSQSLQSSESNKELSNNSNSTSSSDESKKTTGENEENESSEKSGSSNNTADSDFEKSSSDNTSENNEESSTSEDKNTEGNSSEDSQKSENEKSEKPSGENENSLSRSSSPAEDNNSDYSFDFNELANEIKEFVEIATQQIEREMQEGETTTFKIADPEVSTCRYFKMPITEDDIDAYEDFASAFDIRSRGRALTASLTPIFKAKKTGFKAETSGKVNLKRYGSGKVTPYIFDKRIDKVNDASVLILIDQSGSMDGENIREAKAMACEMAEAFAKLKIPFAIAGHTWEYNLEFRLYKPFEQKNWQSVANMEALNCNADGAAVRMGYKYLKDNAKSKHKVLIVITDGLSHDEANCAKAVQEAKKIATVIGVSLRVSEEDKKAISAMYGEHNHIVCNKMADLNPLLTKKLRQLAVNW